MADNTLVDITDIINRLDTLKRSVVINRLTSHYYRESQIALIALSRSDEHLSLAQTLALELQQALKKANMWTIDRDLITEDESCAVIQAFVKIQDKLPDKGVQYIVRD